MNRLAVLVVSFVLSLSAAGCGDPCQDAFDKVKSCVASMNCGAYPTTSQAFCSNLQSAFAASDKADSCENTDKILSCDLDPSNFCACR
jgi:hypothetical protein